MVGPMIGATTTTRPKAANACPRLAGGKLSVIIDCSTGASPPPPIPWKIRATISIPRFGDSAHISEAAVKSVIEIMK